MRLPLTLDLALRAFTSFSILSIEIVSNEREITTKTTRDNSNEHSVKVRSDEARLKAQDRSGVGSEDA